MIYHINSQTQTGKPALDIRVEACRKALLTDILTKLYQMWYNGFRMTTELNCQKILKTNKIDSPPILAEFQQLTTIPFVFFLIG